MPDLHDQFVTFHNQIALDTRRKDALRISRDSVRTKIRNHFTDKLELKSPRFHAQGSFAMVTTVVPIDGEFDLDDGVYLQHLDESDQSDWPKTEAVHRWLVDAVNGHTNESPIDKATCVRLRYKGSYHLDLPSYAKCNGEYFLAVKGDAQWKKSDPKAITDWFKGRIKERGEQLRRMVRCLKAWDDYQSGQRGSLANGLILTVMADRWYCPIADQDDDVFANMVIAINAEIKHVLSVRNPVDHGEDLASRLDGARSKRIQEAFADLAQDAENARNAKTKAKASEIWQRQFGSRFPLMTEDEEKEQARKDADALTSFYAPRNPPQPWATLR